jgi:hypothetical protein
MIGMIFYHAYHADLVYQAFCFSQHADNKSLKYFIWTFGLFLEYTPKYRR